MSSFGFEDICYMHFLIFQDVYDWAGKIRIINIEKADPALGGISVEYTNYKNIEKELKEILEEMNEYPWAKTNFEILVKVYSKYISKL